MACAVVWAAALVVMGVATGMPAAAYVPVAAFQGVVLGGMVLVAGMPSDEPDETDDGGRGDTPPTTDLDPKVWGSVLYGAGVDDLERASRHGFELVKVGVVPARVGGAADEPAAAVVGDEHAVALQRGEDHQRLAVER